MHYTAIIDRPSSFLTVMPAPAWAETGFGGHPAFSAKKFPDSRFRGNDKLELQKFPKL